MPATPVSTITFREDRDLPDDQVVGLYASVGWSCARKPDVLCRALRAADAAVTAWDGALLIGIGYAISDGHLVVYYPHLVVAPGYQRRGIGSALMKLLMSRYSHYHQQMLTADGRAVTFYENLGFRGAGNTRSMWIYDGDEH
ncbi:MAG TPA: GNAT family N-acetyltransferase [Gemmatimonadaceae bacterium]|nr:GNAT family N-acetyltransferase [Gemmatimonadaceae bacterium]